MKVDLVAAFPNNWFLMAWRPFAILGSVLLGTAIVAAAPQGRHIRYAEAQPILKELADILPIELKVLPDRQADDLWSAWVIRHDSDIRGRLAQGDEDTIINWLLFGTSFTSQPPAALDQAAAADPEAVRRMVGVVVARTSDLMLALRSPGIDERRRFARRFFEGNGFSFATPLGLDETGNHLRRALQRIAVEQQQFSEELSAARQTGDPETELAIRSTLFHARGLSLDTSLPVNYALEQSLVAMKVQGLLKPGTVRRIAIVGAGLDFADRDVGFDFYPPQTVQPFAVVDSLRKLQLAPASGSPEVVIFDISPRVIDHITRARMQASSGRGYTINLALAKRKPWLPELREYWRTFGARVGVTVPTSTKGTVADQADVRVVRIPAALVQHVSVADLDIVTERLDDSRFDLIIATNVLLFYDAFEQELATANIEAMLRDGGILLSNTALPEIEAVALELVGSLETSYSSGTDGDQILWYQRIARR